MRVFKKVGSNDKMLAILRVESVVAILMDLLSCVLALHMNETSIYILIDILRGGNVHIIGMDWKARRMANNPRITNIIKQNYY